mgnify:CR=1 FL=1
MRTVRRVAAPLALLLVVACTSSHHARDAYDPASTLAALDALPLADTFAAWTPDPADLALAAEVGTPAGAARLAALEPAARVRVLRAGLRLPSGPAAAACARALPARACDLAEHRVATRLLLDDFLARQATDPDASLWLLIEHFAAADVVPILERLHGLDGSRLDEARATVLHKVMRPEFIPAVAELASSLSAPSEQLDELVWLDAWQTDRERDAILRWVLGDAGTSLPASTAAPGVPPLLRAYLERTGPESAASDDRYGGWALRWLRDVRPTDADAPLLLAAAESSATVRWSLRQLRDARSRAWLERRIRTVPSDHAARAALAVRGDTNARADLLDAAAFDADACALALEIDPAAACDALARVLLDPRRSVDDESVRDCLDAVFDAQRAPRAIFGLTWTRDVFDGFDARLLAAHLDARRMLHVARVVPTCWTRRVAEAAASALGDAPPRGFLEDESVDDVLPLLELGAPDALRAALRRWCANLGDAVVPRADVLFLLLRLGDPASAEELVAAVRDGMLGAADEQDALILLARTDAPATRAYLRSVAAGDAPAPPACSPWSAVCALAVLDGLPPTVALVPDEQDAAGGAAVSNVSADELAAELRALVLAGRPLDAYARMLEARADDAHECAGDVRDARVTSYLRRLCERRELELVPFATAELAIQGDTAARAETWQAVRTGAYRWCDELDARQRTLGWETATLPAWVDFAESSCCQLPTAERVLRDVLGVSSHSHRGRDCTLSDLARRAIRDRPGPYVRSRLTAEFEPVPR